MVHFKRPNVIEDSVLDLNYPHQNSSNMTGLSQIRPGRQRGVPVNSPLEEYVVFSDSEEELEYVQQIHGASSRTLSSINCPKVQSDVENPTKLRDILKLLSTCRFENATKTELEELVNISKWINLKYLEINQSPRVSSSVCVENDALSNGNVETEVEALPEDPKMTSTNIITESKVTKQKHAMHKSKKRKLKEIQKFPEITCEKSNVVIPNKNVRIVESEALSVENREEKLITNLQDKEKKHTRNKSGTKAENKKQQKIYSKKKNMLDGSKPGEFVNDNNKQYNSQCDDETFKTPLLPPKGKSLVVISQLNPRRFSLPIQQYMEKNKLLFTSFQCHLKRRKLHSPSEWLNSVDFETSCPKE